MQVIEDGVQIRLIGKTCDYLFIWALAMLLCSVLVAVICFTMPVPYAIGAVALWAVLMYFFNQKKHTAKTQQYHAQGLLVIKQGFFSINGMNVRLSENAWIQADQAQLTICDKGCCHHFVGFADEREVVIAKAVLEGQKIAIRQTTIKMGTPS
ncbi:hypothetical protein [Moraxella sp. ZY200743]|uniref:hypothetical protein n=1 Tax=Moraxella sp. ZY200743 TaxID=2911970 RepID=UPI003D7DACAC